MYRSWQAKADVSRNQLSLDWRIATHPTRARVAPLGVSGAALVSIT